MSKKFVAVMNKSIETPRLLNALAHCTAGLAGANGTKDTLGLVEYVDAEDNSYDNISKYGFIILKASGGKLKTLRDNLLEAKIPHTCFLDTMIEGGWEDQIERTKGRKHEDLTFHCVTAFGDKQELDQFTGKFSLFR